MCLNPDQREYMVTTIKGCLPFAGLDNTSTPASLKTGADGHIVHGYALWICCECDDGAFSLTSDSYGALSS